MKKSLYIALLFSLLSLNGFSQMRMMCYNLLNFPNGNFAGRVDTLENIIDYYRPHLLMVQELQSEDGLIQITDMMDDLGYGDFAHGDFIQQQSDPFNPYYLQQNIVFDQNYIRLKSQQVLITDIRDINYYKMYFNDANLVNGTDTSFLHVFVTHLKSSSGNANEQLRLQMVEVFEEFISSNLSATDNIIFAGDFNIYSMAEPAYQLLIEPSNPVVMVDPLGALGNWPSINFAHKEILTQSTRSSQIGNDGAGGGLDDRFDFIMMSSPLMSSTSPIHFIEGTYKSLGNNGTCYNQSITNCAVGNEVPTNVLQSIYYMSDHIPQVCEVEVDLTLGIAESDNTAFNLQLNSSNPANEKLAFTLWSRKSSNVQIQLFNINGSLVFQQNVVIGAGSNYNSINTEHFTNGLYFLCVNSSEARLATEKILIQH